MSIRALPSSQAAYVVSRLVALALLLAVAACSTLEQLPPEAGAQLFARGLDDINDLYLEPLSLRRLALSGALFLSRLDGKLGIETRLADAVTLTYEGRDIAFYPIPAANTGREWGELLANLVAAAKQTSPLLAALPQEKMETAVLQGITAPLDAFSHYSGPEMARDQRAKRNGFGGIGVTVDASDRVLRVSEVSPQSPADRAGIRPEDQIVAINGVATAGWSPEDAVHQLRGPVGSAVALRVSHAGGAAREVQLHRDFVTMPTVTMTRDRDIAVFRVSSFNRSTAQRLAEGLAEAQRQSGGRITGIVLDLRSNPGGLLDQAVSLADLFIHGGAIAATVGRHPASRQYFAASGDSIAPSLPLAVLINGGSASAAEIVAAALQDAGRAVVIGSSSFGKGTVQTVLRLPNNGELTLTWARLVAPAGYLLQQHGVVPTLCTAALPDDPSSDASGLQQTAMQLRAGVQARPRAALDEAAWSELRRTCPANRSRPPIDLTLAERLLGDPALYSAALHAMPAAAQVAAQVAQGAPVTGPSPR